LYVVYAVASAVFRWQLTIVIAVALFTVLKPYGLHAVGLLLGAVAVVAGAARGFRSAFRAWREAGVRGERSWRPRLAGGVVGALAIAAFLTPFPVVVTAPLVVEPVGAQQAYVTTPGRLAAIRVRPGQRVKRGDVLIELANRDLSETFRQVKTAYDVQRVAVTVHQAAGELAEESVATDVRDALYKEAVNCRERLVRLRVTAPCDGTVIAPPAARQERGLGGRSPLAPLEAANLGAQLPVGTPVATVAPGDAFQAVLLVDQTSSEHFAPGAKVRLKLEHAPSEVIRGAIESQSIPDEQYRLGGDAFASEKIAASTSRPGARAPRVSQAIVALAGLETPVVAGLRGEARMVVFHPSLASWLWRQARYTFSFL
jgi:multidrug efflux pump subunit AcrA (membrane-fusion protein)